MNVGYQVREGQMDRPPGYESSDMLERIKKNNQNKILLSDVFELAESKNYPLIKNGERSEFRGEKGSKIDKKQFLIDRIETFGNLLNPEFKKKFIGVLGDDYHNVINFIENNKDDMGLLITPEETEGKGHNRRSIFGMNLHSQVGPAPEDVKSGDKSDVNASAIAPGVIPVSSRAGSYVDWSKSDAKSDDDDDDDFRLDNNLVSFGEKNDEDGTKRFNSPKGFNIPRSYPNGGYKQRRTKKIRRNKSKKSNCKSKSKKSNLHRKGKKSIRRRKSVKVF